MSIYLMKQRNKQNLLEAKTMAPKKEPRPQVLIIDDDAILRAVARTSLERAGISISEAVNGVEGLEAVKRLKPEIVLLDVMMPEMNGYDTCRAIRELPGGDSIPVVMVTALEDVESINRAYEVGATDFMTKPIEWIILVQRVRYLLRAVRQTNERKQLAKRLQQARKMEAVGTLASGIAHDFKNVLQVIQGSAELLMLGKSDDDPGYEDVHTIFDASQRGVEIVQQMLSYGRKLESIKKRIDLNHQVRQVKSLLKSGNPSELEVILNLEKTLPPVDADAGQISQVLINLVKNARDAMPDGGKLVIRTASITLTPDYCKSQPNLDPGSYVCISVADSGQGMAKETLEQIFDPFFTTKRADKGTGLGLAMVYGIIQNHDGLITCKSVLGKGTLFNIFLPAAARPRKAVAKKAVDVVLTGNETILLVEDVATIQLFAKRFLEKSGYNVLTAKDGVDALKLYREEKDRIGMILLDLIMPNMGGEKCLQELLQIDPGVKVVIASANKPEESSWKQIDSQTRGYLRKPYLGDDLLGMVRNVLDQE
jgi:two-component system cell cycle sensor histidine kinase/response regulator CckA